MPINNRRVRLIPYKQGSRSCAALAEAIGAKQVKLVDSRYRNTERDFTINWGSTQFLPNIDYRYVLNHPEAIALAANKLSFFQRVAANGHANLVPQFWTNKKDIPDEAFPIVCRTLLNAHSGRGIVIADGRDQLVDAPLYTQYVKKQDEFRIHLGYGFKPEDKQESIIIAVQQKKRRLDHPDEQVNWKVRNHANGFIYARENVRTAQAVIDAAKIVFEQCTDLDFGAVDVIYNAKSGRAYVLEINTAPGLEGQTLEDYANFFPKGRQ